MVGSLLSGSCPVIVVSTDSVVVESVEVGGDLVEFV